MNKLVFRKVDWNNLSVGDKHSILVWANEMLMHKISTERPITSQQHNAWIAQRVKKEVLSHLWIIELSGNKVGHVRVDKKQENEFYVDVFITPTSRGEKIGYKAIEYVINYCFNNYNNCLFIAAVKISNLASQKLFESHKPDYTNKQKDIITYIWDNNEEILEVVSDYQI